MRASQLRHIIEFQTPTTASDGMGGYVPSAWVTDKTTRAEVTPIGSTITYENGQNRAVKSWRIVTRYTKDFEITHKTRVVWNERILTPSTVVNVDTWEKWMEFEATEKVE